MKPKVFVTAFLINSACAGIFDLPILKRSPFRFIFSRDISFQLYTRSNSQQQTTLDTFWGHLGHFNSSWRTRILIHGSNSGTDIELPIKDEYLTNGDYNVILLDWSVPAKDPFYIFAKGKVPFIGQKLGSLIDFLVTKGLNLSQLHIIGHDLGAHIAGVAGEKVKGTVGRITGLEPASMFYEKEKLENRLDKSDAAFVEIIYTSQPDNNFTLGHADFYVNKEDVQPGCENQKENILFRHLKALQCSRNRPYAYFAESINSNLGFQGLLCSSWESYDAGKCFNNPIELMGEPTNLSSIGKFYVTTTSSSSPYAEMIEITWNSP